MVFTNEMEEVISFVSSHKDFVFFDSFADYLLAGVEPDLNIEFLCSSFDTVSLARDFFLSNGWKVIRSDSGNDFFVVDIKKNFTVCKILFSKSACNVLFSESNIVKFKNFRVPCLNVEALFLSTLNQVSAADRATSKIEKDREALSMLRKKIDVEHFKQLVSKTHKEFWSHSYL